MCAKVAINPNSRIYFDEFDLSGVLNSTQLGVDQELPVVTCISDAGPRRVVAGYDVKASDLGFLEPTDDGYDEQIFAALNDGDTDHYLTKLFGASAEGSVAYDAVMRLASQPRSARAAGAILLNFDSEGANGLVRGLVLGNKTSTGAENLTGQNQGTTTAGQIYAVIFRVLAFTGTDIAMAVQESSDDGSGDAYTTILASGTLTAIGVVRATTAAALEAWRRVAITGTYTSATILVTAGVVQGT